MRRAAASLNARVPVLRLAVVASALAASLVLAGGATTDGQPPPPGPAPGGLGVGLTEFDPALVSPPEPPRPGLGRQRGASLRLSLLRPAYLRVVVLWSEVQPDRYRAINWAARSSGGHSVLAQLRAVARARARAGGGFEPVVTFYGTPKWARTHIQRCEPPRAESQARAPDATAMPGYQAMVRSLIALGRREGVELRLFSPWNEPNSGHFLSPQRLGCATTSRSVAPATYGMLARALRGVLDADPGDQQIVLGDTSSPFRARPQITGVREFVDGLAPDVLCAGGVWAQHQYVGDANRVGELESALDSRPCAGQPPKRVWITETGVGGLRAVARRHDAATLRRGCQALHAALLRWYADPRIDAAFQYTFREDPNFPVGLEGPALDPLYPTYWLWRAWGGPRQPNDPPPPLPPQCR